MRPAYALRRAPITSKKTNDPLLGGEVSKVLEFGSTFKFNQAQKGSLLGGLKTVIIEYDGEINSALGFEMLEALKLNKDYPNPNTVFYADFFSIMIFVDVLLLIISFIYHFSFFTIFRNASFIITTILIRISLTIEKPMNYIIILIGFLFSIISFYLYSLRNTNNKQVE